MAAAFTVHGPASAVLGGASIRAAMLTVPNPVTRL